MQCLVTGASGYIGFALTTELLAQRCRVRGQWCRNDSLPEGTEGVQADLTAALPAEALAGVDTVFHLAGLAHSQASTEVYGAINVAASEALFRAAAAAGCRRFVFMSSAKALLAERGDPRADEYARSKWHAEQALLAQAASGGPELVIVRPALVYGGECRGYLCWLERWVRLHLPAPPEGGQRAMIARKDLLRLLLALRTAPLATPATLTVSDGECYSARRLHAALCSAARRRPWLPTPPRVLWRAAARMADVVASAPAGSTWERLQGDEIVQPTDLDAMLDFRPGLTFEAVASAEAPRS